MGFYYTVIYLLIYQFYWRMENQYHEKQRFKLYQDYLKMQIQRNANLKKEMHLHEKKEKPSNKIIEKLNSNDVMRLKQRKQGEIQMARQNSQLYSMRNSGLQIEKIQNKKEGIHNDSFMHMISDKNELRLNKSKQKFMDGVQQNTINLHILKDRQKLNHSLQKQQEERHMNRLQQLEDQRQRVKAQIKRKHHQNMKMYELHSQLLQQNEQHKKNIQKFTQNQQTVLNKLIRKQDKQAKIKIYKSYQQELQHQIQQKNNKSSLQKLKTKSKLQGGQPQEGIFRKLSDRSPKNKRKNQQQYKQQLLYQMEQMNNKRNAEKQIRSHILFAKGILTGVQGYQRANQLDYIDRKMGIKSSLNKSFNESKLQKNQTKSPQMIKKTESYTQKHEYESLPTIQPKRNPQNQPKPMQKSPKTPKKVQNFNYDPIPNPVPINTQIPIYTQISSPNSPLKLYRSYDLIAGTNKFFG